MKTTIKIARTELQTLFYSPVAWLIITIFSIQCTAFFSDLMTTAVRQQYLGVGRGSITQYLFGSSRGFFTYVAQQHLYLYIPLLTMGVMSREFRSGSIKLLYSSPLTNSQIILGKYLALVIFGLSLVAMLMIPVIYACFVIQSIDILLILSGLLGIFLLICAYSAIGLFVSSLTSYSVVAAIGTLAIFALLNYARGLWQDIAIVRDITYWLALSGRVESFISGMITTEHLLYYLVVISLFVTFTILRLQAGRQRNSGWSNFSRYAAVFLVAMLLGYISSRPSLKAYADLTRTRVNTLTEASQEVMRKMKGPLKITTYVNMLDPYFNFGLPKSYKIDVNRYQQYMRFKPDMEMEYVYYYHHAKNERLDRNFPKLNDRQRVDTLRKVYSWDFDILPYDAINKQVDLSDEEFRFVRLVEAGNGKKTFLRSFNDMNRMPFEAENTAAFKRLVMDLPVAGFLTGHGERSSDGEEDRGYNLVAREKSFRYSLINQGFDFRNMKLDQPVPADIRILVIAELRDSLTAPEIKHLRDYVRRGGNLLIAGEPGREVHMNMLTKALGVEFLPGVLVKSGTNQQADLIMARPTTQAAGMNHHFSTLYKNGMVVTMPSAGALAFNSNIGYKVQPLFVSDSTGGWIENTTRNFADSMPVMDRDGEVEKAYPVMLALSRKIGNREQRIIVAGDADWLSNGELGRNRKDVKAGNFYASNGIFYWLSDNEVPVDMSRPDPIDTKLRVDKKGWELSSVFLKWVLPLLIGFTGIVVWLRRRNR